MFRPCAGLQVQAMYICWGITQANLKVSGSL